MHWSLRFSEPWWLLLLLLLPGVVWIGRKSLAGLGPFRRGTAIGVRALVLALIILALAGLQLVRRSEALCTLFVLDQSQSIPAAATEQALDLVDKALADRPSDRDLVGLVVFGKEAKVELPPAEYPRDRRVRSIGSLLDRRHTDVAGAIRLALGAFPPDAAGRIVLLSDGNQNVGDALEQAVAARQAGVPIDVVPIEYRYDAEVLVDKIVLPAELQPGEAANLRIVLRSARPAEGLLRLTRIADGARQNVLEQRVALREGLNVLTRQIAVDEPNFYTYEAEFEPDPGAGDQVARNNLAQSFTWIRGEGKILLLGPRGRSRADLARVLRADKLLVVERTPDQLRESLAELRQYDGVIVSNVPAEDLGQNVQELLATGTRDLGAGLIMVGGPDSFGAGGYKGSVLEKALPVDMEIKATKVRGKGALVLIMHACEIPEGNFWQKRIAKLAIRGLGSQDECGLVYWSGQTSWLFPLQPVGDGRRMNARIDRMNPGDMPDFDSSMRLAVGALLKSDAVSKHVIVISDGDPQPPSLGVIRSFQNARVTCTAVAVAAHGFTERTVMRAIARDTRGRFYDVTNPSTLPEIYIKETRIVSRPLIFERAEPWQPKIAYPSQPVAGLPRELPGIRGFVMTTPKPTAEVAVVSPLPPDVETNPILAMWQYGLGRAAAFTSDAGEKWTADWVGGEVYSKFWTQLVRWAMRSGESDNLTVSTEERNGVVTVVVNAMDKQNEFLDFLRLRGKVIRPNLEGEELAFRQTEPGKYEATFTAEVAGSYLLRIGGRAPDGSEGFVSTGLSISYPPEYRDVESRRDLLESIASITGGRVLDMRSAAEADFFPRDLAPVRMLADGWPIVLLVALVGFLLDVAVRRIAVEPAEVRHWLARGWAVLRRRPPAAASEVIDRLRSVKASVDQELDDRRRAPPRPSRSIDVQAGPKAKAAPAPPAVEPAEQTRTPEPPPREEAEDYARRLLRAKRKTWADRPASGPPEPPPPGEGKTIPPPS